jgi:hypothetical protein
MSDCGCFKCTKARCDADPISGIDHRMTRYFLTDRDNCETCGNKRCPHATDHANACTCSNELGQEGSRYT